MQLVAADAAQRNSWSTVESSKPTKAEAAYINFKHSNSSCNNNKTRNQMLQGNFT